MSSDGYASATSRVGAWQQWKIDGKLSTLVKHHFCIFLIYIFRSQSDDFETNLIIEKSPSGIATVVAKLIVKPSHIPQSGTKRTYTCVGKSGGKIVKASTTVHFNHQGSNHAMGASDMFKTLTGSEKVKIYEYYENLFDFIGSNIFLPCKASPKAEIYWINEEGKVITGQESR